MEYLLENLDLIEKILLKSRHILLLMDYDGTLTPIVSRPDKARLGRKTRKTIKDIACSRKYSVGIITGRELRDIINLVGIKGIFYAGNHGMQFKAPGSGAICTVGRKHLPLIKMIRDLARASLDGIPGLFIEDKKITLSIHFRRVAATRQEQVKKCIRALGKRFADMGLVKMTEGKKVIEIRPPEGWNKGDAVKNIKQKFAKCKNALTIYIGDDKTDEDAYAALSGNDIPVNVGRKKYSRARYFVDDTEEVFRFLQKLPGVVRHG